MSKIMKKVDLEYTEDKQQVLLEVTQNSSFRYVVYMATILCGGSLVGLMGTYAVLKDQIGKQLFIKEGFLGFLDAFSFLGRIFGYLWITFYPTSTPKKDFYISSIFTCILLAFVPLSSTLPQFCQLILMVAMFLSGFSRAYIAVPNMIMLHYFDSKRDNDRIFINFWSALITMGDVVAIIFTTFLIQLQFSWQLCFYVNIFVFFVCSSILFLISEQIKLQNSNQQQNIREIKTHISQNVELMKNFYSKNGNLSWLIDNTLVTIMYYNILMWFPYFFIKYGFNFQASIISIMYPTFALFSVGLYEYVLRKRKICEKYLVSLMHLFNFLFYVAMLFMGTNMSDAKYFIILVALSGLTQGGAFSEVSSLQLRMKTNNNLQMLLVIASTKFSSQLISILAMMLIGFCMQFYLKSFLYILVANTLCTLIVHSWRTTKYGYFVEAAKMNKEQQEKEIKQRQKNVEMRQIKNKKHGELNEQLI